MFDNWDEYEWNCDLYLKIYMGGILQLTYKFCMKATLSRLNTNTLTITITPNLIIAECCDNTLHIETIL